MSIGVDTVLYTFMLLVAVGNIISFFWRRRPSKTHGDAAFGPWPGQTARRRSGLAPGFILGKTEKGEVAGYSGDGHLALLAPTGKGKSTRMIAHNILQWGGSQVVVDMKGELTLACARELKAAGIDVRRIDPFGLLDGKTDVPSVGINPLLECESSSDFFEAINLFAEDMLPGGIHADDKFVSAARGMAAGLGAAVLHMGDDPSPGRIFRVLLEGYSEIRKLADQSWPEEIENLLLPTLNELEVTSPNSRGIFLQTIQQHLRFLGNPKIAETLRGNWSPKNLLDPDRPTALFLVMPPQYLASQAPFLRMVFGCVERALLDAGESRERRLLFVFDEAPALGGDLHLLREGITKYRGYGATFLLAYQDLGQMNAVYGHHAARSILANCNQLFWACRDLETLIYISKLLGSTTVVTSRNPGRVDEKEQQLRTADQARRMPEDQVIAFFDNSRPTLLRLLPHKK